MTIQSTYKLFELFHSMRIVKQTFFRLNFLFSIGNTHHKLIFCQFQNRKETHGKNNNVSQTWSQIMDRRVFCLPSRPYSYHMQHCRLCPFQGLSCQSACPTNKHRDPPCPHCTAIRHGSWKHTEYVSDLFQIESWISTFFLFFIEEFIYFHMQWTFRCIFVDLD